MFRIKQIKPAYMFLLLFIILTVFPSPSSGETRIRFLSRFDGLLIELLSEFPQSCPEVKLNDYTLTVITASSLIEIPEELPFWVVGARISTDGFSLILDLDESISSVDWAMADDSLTVLFFLRADTPITFSEFSWITPPEEPIFETDVEYSDSLLVASLSSGNPSPWLEDFDCIVIDPGHGGRDPGAVGWRGTYEKDRTLEISLLLRDLITVRMPDVRIVLTRETDEYVSLGARTRIANAERADLFISIHINAAVNRNASGFETFFLSRARTDDARAVAALENGAISYDNESDYLPSDPLSFILADIAQSLYLNQSSMLAGLIQDEISMRWREGRNRGVKQAGFYVLKGAYMPAVLVEAGFISNPSDEALLQTLDFRLRIAEAIYGGIDSFIREEV